MIVPFVMRGVWLAQKWNTRATSRGGGAFELTYPLSQESLLLAIECRACVTSLAKSASVYRPKCARCGEQKCDRPTPNRGYVEAGECGDQALNQPVKYFATS